MTPGMIPKEDISMTHNFQGLKKRFLVNVAGLVLPIIAIILTAAFLIWLGADPTALDRGQLIIGFPIAAFWLWLGVKQIITVLRLQQDIKSGDVRTVSGFVERAEKRGFGIFAPTRILLKIGSLTLYPANEPLPVSGQDVVAVYAPKSQTLLTFFPTIQRLERNEADLTEQEQALLKLLSDGLSDKLIARDLDLSPATVRTYNSRLFQKMGAKNRKDAVDMARASGYLNVD